MQLPSAIQKLSDEDLVSAIVKDNNTLLFEVLYDRYASLVYNKCYGFARDGDEAKDLTQDVFLNLFVKLASFKHKSKFSTWLYAFTYNYCVNYVTRNTAKKIEKKSVSPDVMVNVSDTEPEIGFADMKVEKLKKVIELIAPDEKMILLLKYEDGLSIKEISSALDLGESAVKMRIKRAKAKLVHEYTNYVSHG